MDVDDERMQKRNILISNDDGIHSFGIRALAEALASLGKVTVVAPDREQSACSHSLTLRNPLRVEKLEEGFYAVDGTPTDCINLAVNAIDPSQSKSHPDCHQSVVRLCENPPLLTRQQQFSYTTPKPETG